MTSFSVQRITHMTAAEKVQSSNLIKRKPMYLPVSEEKLKSVLIFLVVKTGLLMNVSHKNKLFFRRKNK